MFNEDSPDRDSLPTREDIRAFLKEIQTGQNSLIHRKLHEQDDHYPGILARLESIVMNPDNTEEAMGMANYLMTMARATHESLRKQEEAALAEAQPGSPRQLIRNLLEYVGRNRANADRDATQAGLVAIR